MTIDLEALAQLRALFEEAFGALESGTSAVFASAPGRLELAGNHTDHQGGWVISAALDRHVLALAVPHSGRHVDAFMEGVGSASINLDGSLEPQHDEAETSAALIRGMLAQFQRSHPDIPLQGFNLVTTSTIPIGGGVSSSAAFEMLLGVLIHALHGCSVEPVELALMGQEVENRWFGKQCGAQDQIASACGGVVAMDFSQDPPGVTRLPLDLKSAGLVPLLIDSRCDHSLFTDAFNGIFTDMRQVAAALGVEILGQADEQAFLSSLDAIRKQLGDRVVLRALHYYDETARVLQQKDALEQGDVDRFLRLMRLSGASSAQYLQNVALPSGQQQTPLLILGLCSHLLGTQGAWRIHGGGFGGNILALVPEQQVEAFIQEMNGLLGYAACMEARIAPEGAAAETLAL